MKTNQLQSSGSSVSVQDYSLKQLKVMTKAVSATAPFKEQRAASLNLFEIIF